MEMKITEDVTMLESTKGSHVYLVKGESPFLIDTGIPRLAKKILAELGSLGVSPADISMILLTHHDVDHIGNAKALQDLAKAKLFAPKEDIPYITGAKNRPGLKRVIQTLTRPQKPDSIEPYADNQTFGELHTIKAPGHTPGHTIFQYRNVLFTGDLFRIMKGRFQIMPAFMTWNTGELKKSIHKLKDLQFDWICPGHGEPIRRGQAFDDFAGQIYKDSPPV